MIMMNPGGSREEDDAKEQEADFRRHSPFVSGIAEDAATKGPRLDWLR